MPVQEYTVKLFRDSLDTPWGFRLQGGADFHTSLSIQRVFTGSPAEGELQRGDIILAIDNSDASCMSHALAEDLIRSSGGDLVLRIRRASPASSLPNTVYQTEQPAKMSWRTTSDHSASQSYGTDFASQGRGQAKGGMLNQIQHNLANKIMHSSVSPSVSTQERGGYPAAPYPQGNPQSGSVGHGTSFGYPDTDEVRNIPQSYGSAYNPKMHGSATNLWQPEMPTPFDQPDYRDEQPEELESFEFKNLRNRFESKEQQISKEVEREEEIRRLQEARNTQKKFNMAVKTPPPPTARKPSVTTKTVQQISSPQGFKAAFQQRPLTNDTYDEVQPNNPSYEQQMNDSRGDKRHLQQGWNRPIVQPHYQPSQPQYQTSQSHFQPTPHCQPASQPRYNRVQQNSPLHESINHGYRGSREYLPSQQHSQARYGSGLERQQSTAQVNVHTQNSPTHTGGAPLVHVIKQSPWQNVTYVPDEPDALVSAQLNERRHPMQQPRYVTIARPQSIQSSTKISTINPVPSQPGTRTSYAEITLSHPGISPRPEGRDTRVQRADQYISALDQNATDHVEQEIYPDFNELRQQFLLKEREELAMKSSTLPPSMGTSFATGSGRRTSLPVNDAGFNGVNRRSSIQIPQSTQNRLQSHATNVDPRMQQYYYPSNNNYSAPSGVQSSGWAPVQPNPVQYDHQQPNSKFYQPLSFNKPAPTATYIQKPTRNPYSSTASAAHLQYNSPLGLYSAKNAQSALNMMVPNDSAAGQTIKLTSHQGGESRNDIVDSPTLRTVLLEDKVKATTGHAPNVTFYKKQHEYGPGKVPLRAYVEDVQDNVGISDF